MLFFDFSSGTTSRSKLAAKLADGTKYHNIHEPQPPFQWTARQSVVNIRAKSKCYVVGDKPQKSKLTWNSVNLKVDCTGRGDGIFWVMKAAPCCLYCHPPAHVGTNNNISKWLQVGEKSYLFCASTKMRPYSTSSSVM